MMTVNKLIQFDEYTGNIPLPRLVLMTRSFEIIHTIPHFTNWRASIRGNELDEISFEVTKYVNGVLNPVWDDLIDLKIVSVECDRSVDDTGHECGKFEITVSYADENKTTKTVTGVSLETELGQLMLHDFHVNDEFYYEGQEQEGLTEYIPTVLYIHNATEEQKKYSLLHRVLADKAPHWKISEQEDRVAKMAYVVPEDKGVPEASSDFNREYTVDGTSIYDFLTGDVAKDANIVFRFDTDKRELWFESLVDYVPEVGSSEPTVDGVGEDTTILVSKAKLGNSINIESNKDNVKNCFRVEGGDDLMTSQVAVVNLTGTNYIYHFADFQLADMPETLQQAISGYNAELADPSTQDEYYGENGLYTQYTEANAQYYYLRDEMAPSIHVDPPATPYDQWLELKQKLEDPDMEIGVYMTNSYDSEHYVGITNNVAAMLEVWCDSRYTVEVLKSPAPSYDATNLIWTGYVRVTDYKDTTQHYPLDSEISSHPFTAKITQDSDDDLTFTRQKLEIALAKGDMYSVDEQVSDSMTEEEIIEYFSEWNLTKLQSFQTGYDTCKSVLMSGTVLKNGTTVERTIAENLMAEYDRRLRCVATVIAIREAELKDQQDILDRLIGYSSTDANGNTIYTKGKIQEFQEEHSFYSYLVREYSSEADSLYSKFHAYIREDTYQNSNYTSESLETQKDLTDKAKELLEQADREIKKACVLQRTMTVSMNNLMAIPEFKVLQKKFEMFNYIRVRTEDEILKLRLIGVDYSGDSMETVEVTFSDQIESVDGTISDLQSILNQAQAIATTYTAVSGQASKGSSAKDYIIDAYRYGLDAASVMLKNSDDNEVTITSAGIIAKRMDDQGFYGDKQLRIIGNGMYMTEDAWNTVSMAVGEIQFANPITHQTSWKYGVIADAIVGKILVGQNLYIGNDSGSVEIDGNGIKITNGTITWGGSNVNSPTTDDIPDSHSSISQSLSATLTGIDDAIEDLDNRRQTYSQAEDPSTDWTTTEEKDKHVGDIWYDTVNQITYIYSKEGNVYEWEENHDSLLEELAKSKSTIYIAKPTEKDEAGYLYKKGDLWIIHPIPPATTIIVNGVAYKADTVLTAIADNLTTTFIDTDWVPATTKDATDFASDSAITPGEKIQLKYTIIDIDQEYLEVSTQAAKYTMSITDYTTAYTALKTYLFNSSAPILGTAYSGTTNTYDNMDTTTTITPATYQTKFTNYYSARKTAESNLETARTEYADGVLSEWVSGDFATYKADVETQLDHKVVTYYQTTKPYNDETNVDSNATRESRVGDLWYKTNATGTGTDYKTWIYTKTANGNKWNYAWVHDNNIPDALFDRLDGKKDIYVLAPTSDSDEDGYLYRKGDMWIISSADQSSSNVTVKNLASQYSVNTILASSVDRKTTFTASDWSLLTTESAEQALSDISDMCNDGKLTGAEKIQTKRRLAEIDDEYAVYTSRKNAYSDNTSVATAYTTYNTKYQALKTQSANWALNSTTTTDITTASFTNYFTEYYTAKETLDSALEAASKKYAEDQAGDVNTALNTFKGNVQGALMGDSTTTISSDSIISPKIGGGYLYIANADTKRSVTIDPAQTYSSGGYIFKVTDKDGNTTIGADSNGNATFTGGITANSLTIQPNASISGMKIISSVAYAYANSDTNVQPSDSSFGPTMNPQKGKYLWTRTTTSYQGGSYPDDKVYTCAYVGNDGITATVQELSISVAAVTKASDSNTYTPSSITLSASEIVGESSPTSYSGRFKIETFDGSTWTSRYTSSSNESSKTYTIPTNVTIKSIRCSLYEAGGLTKLLDQQTVPIVTNGAKGDKGDEGDKGDDAYTVILTNESHTFAGSTSAAVASSTSTAVIGYKGATQVATTIGTISARPTGMTTTINNNGTTNTSITIAVTTSMVTANGILTIPVTVDGKTFNMVFSYAIAFTGEKGATGDTGATGTSISKTRMVYAVSNSSSTAPSSSDFSPSRPSSITSTQFVWTRCDYTYSTATDTWILGTPVYDPVVTAECKSSLVVETTTSGIYIHPLGESTAQPSTLKNYMLLTNTALDFAINGKAKAHFGTDGIWLGGSSSTSGSFSNYAFKVDTSGNGYFSGNLTASSGTIGGWTINGTTGLKYQNPNDVNDFILLNSVDKSLVSQTDDEKTVLTSGRLKFYYGGTHYSTFMPTKWVGTNKRGTAVNSEATAEFIAFGHLNTSTNVYDSNLVLNYGVNPDGYTQNVILYGSVRTTGSIYVNGSDYINGSGTTYNGLYISSALKCDRIYAGNYIHGDYALDVNGTSYFSSYMYIGSTSYYLSSWSISGTLVGMGTNGTFAAATGLRVGSTAWTSYTASVHGSFYATNIRADAWGTGRYNSSYNHSLYGSLAVLDNSGNRATITANLSGNVTGNCSGSSGSCTGNAATATTASSCSGNSATATLSRRVQHTDSSIYVYMSTNDNFVPSASTVSCGTSAAPFSNFVKSSDRRIKKNITYLKEQMTPLEEMYFDLLPATYKFTTIEDGKTHMGFISQDVEAAMKKHGISSIIGDIGFGALGKDLKEDSVNKYTEEEIKADSIKEEDLSYALCYDEFIALNTHMIQKLYKRVEELEAELSELKKQK